MPRDHQQGSRDDVRVWTRARSCLLVFLLPALHVSLGCQSKKATEAVIDKTQASTPDRLSGNEQLPEAEIVFGLPIPKGMRLTRQFEDAAYLTGELDVASALEHVRPYVEARSVEVMNGVAIFAQAYIKGDARRHQFRIEISKTPGGSQVHVRDITPPPSTSGLTEAERWQRAGRKPDGSLLDPNQVY